MSASGELQKFILDTLKSNARLAQAVGQRIHESPPKNLEYPYISIGPSGYIPDDAECIPARIETVQIDGWSQQSGSKSEVRRVADLICEALHYADGDLGVNALVSLRVVSVRVLNEPDGLTAHAAITLEALVEEN